MNIKKNIENLGNEYKKGFKENGEILNEIFYRPISFPFMLIAKKLKISPNFVSLIAFVFTLLSGIFIALQFYVLAGICLFLRHIFDNIDGFLARNIKKISKNGALIDAIGDFLGFVFVVIGLMVNDFLQNQDFIIILYGALMGASLGLQVLAYDKFRAKYVKGLDTYSNHHFQIFCIPEEKKDDIGKKIEKKLKKKSIGKMVGNAVDGFLNFLIPIPQQNIPKEINQSERRKIIKKYNKIYKKSFSIMHKLWSLVGGAVITTTYIVFIIIGRIDLVWIFITGVLNAIVFLLAIIQNISAYIFRIKIKRIFKQDFTVQYNPFNGKPIPI